MAYAVPGDVDLAISPCQGSIAPSDDTQSPDFSGEECVLKQPELAPAKWDSKWLHIRVTPCLLPAVLQYNTE
jgi:hypothetical protein